MGELAYDPAIVPLGIDSKEMKLIFQRDTCTPVFTETLTLFASMWMNPENIILSKKESYVSE